MRVSAALPTGVAALLFDSARRRRRLEARLVAVLEDAGYAEAVLPVIDYLDPYQAMLSPESRSELYRFVDRDGEVLALRADFTPMLARLIAPRLPSLELPLRLFYRGDVLRYQEERPGAEREFYQVGGEALGLPAAAAEAEALRRFLALLAATERPGLRVVLGFAGALDGLLGNEPARARRLVAAVARRERKAARAAGPALLEVVEEGVPSSPAALGEEAGARLEALAALRDEMARAFPSLALELDLAEFADQVCAPGLRAQVGPRAYYDGLIFRAYGGGRGLPVGGGGRYDRLFRALGAEITAAGFSLSVDRLAAGAAEAPA